MVKKRKRALQEEGPPDVAPAEINNVLLSGKDVQASNNSAKLTLDLLESATTQLFRRMGWFRDVRLRRSAAAFMRSSKLHQQASGHANSEDAHSYAKPLHHQIQTYEEELKKHIQRLQARFKAVPMNERRNINIRESGLGKVPAKELAKVRQLRERAAELEKKPRSVIKGQALQKKRLSKGKSKLSAVANNVKSGKEGLSVSV